MNLQSNSILRIGAFLIALLFCSCSTSSFLHRKYLPGSFVQRSAAVKSEVLVQQDISGTKRTISDPDSGLAAEVTIPAPLDEVGNDLLLIKSRQPVYLKFIRKKPEGSILAYMLHPQQPADTTHPRQPAVPGKFSRAQNLGALGLMASVLSYIVLFSTLAFLASANVIFILIIALFFCLLAVCLAIAGRMTADANGEKRPISAKLALLLSIIELGVPAAAFLLLFILFFLFFILLRR